MNTELEKISQELSDVDEQRTKYMKLFSEAEESGDEALLEKYLKAYEELAERSKDLTDKLLNWNPRANGSK